MIMNDKNKNTNIDSMPDNPIEERKSDQSNHNSINIQENSIIIEQQEKVCNTGSGDLNGDRKYGHFFDSLFGAEFGDAFGVSGTDEYLECLSLYVDERLNHEVSSIDMFISKYNLKRYEKKIR